MDPWERLKERETLLRHAERIARVGSWMWNPATGEVTWSDECRRILGYDDSVEPSVQRFFEALHPEDRAKVEERSAVVARGEVRTETVRVAHADGTQTMVELTNSVVQRSDGTHCIVGTLQDVTQATHQAQALIRTQKMEALGTLAGAVAHDVNNYLMIVQGNAEAAASLIDTDHSAQLRLDTLLRAADRCAALTRQLLALSRPTEVRSSALDLAALVREAAILGDRLIGPRITLDLELPDTPTWVAGDAATLEQILLNLLVNARDAMPEGGRVTLALEPGDPVSLTVTDTGPGIPSSIRERIFEPFFTTKEKGTGIGLSTAWTIIHQLGGSLELLDADGASFQIRLPTAQPPAARPPARWGTRSGRILLVEDDPDVLEMVAEQLESAGYEVVRAADGHEGSRALASAAGLTAMVTDVLLPGPSGLQLAHRARTDHPDLPVLLISAHASDEADSPFPMLRKPFARSALLERLDALIHTS